MSKVFKTTTHYEFGYLDGNTEWWPHEEDGYYFIPYNGMLGVPSIDLDGHKDSQRIRESLDARGYDEYPVLMRKIETTYYEAEEVA